MVKNMKGLVIRVKRECINIENDTHVSEMTIDNLNVDFEFENNESKEILYNKFNVLFQIP